MKSEGILEEIKNRLDIVEVISDYVPIKKAGQNYKGLCPFHSEKTPSFIVSPHKQMFHCFGCHAGGDVLGFVMKYENLSFNESLKLLAKKAGIKLKEYSFKDFSEKETIKAIQKEALKLFIDNLQRSMPAKAYLRGRGLKDTAVAEFSLGYAGKGWHTLYEHLKAKGGFPEPLILQSGLVSSGQRGVYDNFRDRIMFPIFNIYGDAIAFGGRVMDDAMPKYLNSPDTPLFKKSENLYALNMAVDEIRKSGYAIIVEGYLDAIMCHQNGFKNAVAPLGTALTAGHLKRLGRFTNDILIIFDGDSAGMSAARRAVSVIIEHGMRPRALILPDGLDPDSILREKGPEHMRGLIGKAGSAIEFLLKTSKSAKTETVKETLGIIAKVNDILLREELIAELSDRSKVREVALREELKKSLKPGPEGEKNAMSCRYNEEWLLLSALIAFPEKAEKILKDITPEDIKDGLLRGIFRKAVSSGKDIKSLLDASEENEKAVIRRLSLEPGIDPLDVERNIDDCIKKIKQRDILKKVEDIDEMIKTAEAKKDKGLLMHLLSERVKLTGGAG